MTRRPHALLITAATLYGGAERSLLLLAEALPAHGVTVTLVCPRGEVARTARQRGIRVAELPLRRVGPVSTRRKGRKRYDPRAVLRLAGGGTVNALAVARLVRRQRVDLLHSNSQPSHLWTALAGRLARRPVVWHLRDIVEPGRGRRVLEAAGRFVAVTVAISEAVAATVEHPRVVVVLNPVAPPPVPAPPRPAEAPFTVGFLGRLDPGKGIEDLLAAARTAPGRLVIVGRTFAGGPTYVEALREQARRSAPGRVEFAGPTAEPWEALAGFDVLAVPSLAEPFGRVAAEGQLAGVAVVAADAGGLREIVTHERDGLLVPPGDPEALAAALRRLHDDPQLRTALVAAGRDSARRFAADAHAAAIRRVYADLLDESRGR